MTDRYNSLRMNISRVKENGGSKRKLVKLAENQKDSTQILMEESKLLLKTKLNSLCK